MRCGRIDFRPSLWPSLLAALGIGILVALGIWQLQRADQKQLIRFAYDARRAERPLTFSGGDASRLTLTPSRSDLRYRRLRVTGIYHGRRQFLLDNRTYRGRAGFQVLTPLRISGSDWGVLVNRGWVPLGRSRQQLPVVPAPAGHVTRQGLLEVPHADALVLGATGYQSKDWPKVVERIELHEMSKLLGYRLLPFVLLLDPEVPGPLIREWHPYYGIGPARHRAYAFQWFALALTLFGLYVWASSRRASEPAE